MPQSPLHFPLLGPALKIATGENGTTGDTDSSQSAETQGPCGESGNQTLRTVPVLQNDVPTVVGIPQNVIDSEMLRAREGEVR